MRGAWLPIVERDPLAFGNSISGSTGDSGKRRVVIEVSLHFGAYSILMSSRHTRGELRKASISHKSALAGSPCKYIYFYWPALRRGGTLHLRGSGIVVPTMVVAATFGDAAVRQRHFAILRELRLTWMVVDAPLNRTRPIVTIACCIHARRALRTCSRCNVAKATNREQGFY